MIMWKKLRSYSSSATYCVMQPCIACHMFNHLSGNAGRTQPLPVSVLKVVKHGECGKRLVVLVWVLSMKRNAIYEEQSENASDFVLPKLKIGGSKREIQCLLQTTKAVFDSRRTERGSTQSYKWMGKLWKTLLHAWSQHFENLSKSCSVELPPLQELDSRMKYLYSQY